MPTDLESVLGAELPERRDSWTPDDVILCHLGLAGKRDAPVLSNAAISLRT